jgi:hypothetical protein
VDYQCLSLSINDKLSSVDVESVKGRVLCIFVLLLYSLDGKSLDGPMINSKTKQFCAARFFFVKFHSLDQIIIVQE